MILVIILALSACLICVAAYALTQHRLVKKYQAGRIGQEIDLTQTHYRISNAKVSRYAQTLEDAVKFFVHHILEEAEQVQLDKISKDNGDHQILKIYSSTYRESDVMKQLAKCIKEISDESKA